MIKLDISKSKEVKFEMKVDGIDNKDLSGSLRLEIDGIEYGFQVHVESESISVVLPPLKNIITRKLKEGEKISAKLEMNGNGYYLQPWNEEIVIKNGVMVEAKLIDSDKPTVRIKEEKLEDYSKNKPSIKKPIYEKNEVIKPKEKIVVTDQLIYKYMESNGVKSQKIQETLYNQAVSEAKTDDKRKILLTLSKYFKKIKNHKETDFK